MATGTFKDYDRDPIEIQLPLAPGRAAASASKPVVLSTEDYAALAGINTKLSPVTYTRTASTIATGGTAQTALAANSSRRGLIVANTGTDDLYFDMATTATVANSIPLSPGSAYEAPSHAVPSGAISVIGATTGQAYSVFEAT